MHFPTRFLILFFLTSFVLPAQDIPIGTWRNHLSYQSGQEVAFANDWIYCRSDNGLFRFSPGDGALETLSKLDGLSENTVQTMAFDPQSQTLVLVYTNSNIDLIRGNEITELSLIRDASIVGSKRINSILIDQQLAYLSADFGLVILDLERLEIRETLLNLGDEGAQISVFGAALSQDSILISSSQGIRIASFSANLQDFASWQSILDTSDFSALPSFQIASLEGQVYVPIEGEGLFRYQHLGPWEKTSFPVDSNFQQVRNLGTQLGIIANRQVYFWNNAEQVSLLSDPLLDDPQDITSDPGGGFWLADRENGLLDNIHATFVSRFPNGPSRGDTWALFARDRNILASSGAYDPNLLPLNRGSGYYSFVPANWSNFNNFDPDNANPIPAFRDIVDIVFNPQTQNLYVASYQDGLLEIAEDGTQTILNDASPGSTLSRDDQGRLQIGGLAVDAQGNVWVSNPSALGAFPSLHRLAPDGSWEGFRPPGGNRRFPLQIVLDDNQFKWVQLGSGGIWVLDELNSQSRILSTSSNDGGLPSNEVNTLEKDRDGQIWVGTSEGIALFFNPFAVFSGPVNAITPIFEGRPLLNSEQIRSILTDGGNQKWVGTDNGLWLFSEDGTQLLSRFRAQDSPLLSDKVLDLAWDAISGELFVATEEGIISYRTGSSRGETSHRDVKIFPNPVRPGYTGTVGISGLVEDANVKITDASGRLFFEAQAQGGTATWNLRDYTGQRARTGVYLIFSTNEEGTETLVSKIAVVE